MASPDVFLSSPRRGSREQINLIQSSSPDLPSVQDILSQKPKRPALRSGSKAVPIPEDAVTTFTSARNLWKSAQASSSDQPPNLRDGDAVVALDDIDSSPPSVTRATSANLRPSTPDRAHAQPIIKSRAICDDPQQPWKKYKPKTPEKSPDSPLSLVRNSSVEPLDNTSSTTLATSIALSVNKSPELPPITTAVEAAVRGNVDEPLLLEPAMARRKIWTPPAQKYQVIPDSDSPTVANDGSSEGENDQPVTSFGSLLSAYKCLDTIGTESESPPTDDSGLKRKLPENMPEVEACGPSPVVKPVVKQKAPRKKPRTITDLATAAYKQPSQPAPDNPSCSTLAAQAKAPPTNSSKSTKAKVRKKPAKASKKKPSPPKPVLFSPETALKQVAKQDFVFGTSSQLAREQSPSFLRELQMAMTTSNQLEHADFVTPLNSDAIEPPEARSRLWELAARDADGDLFDIEVSNIKEGLPQLPPVADDVDPFGYRKTEDRPSSRPIETTQGQSQRDDDSFMTLSNIIPPSPPKPNTGAVDQLAHNIDKVKEDDCRSDANSPEETPKQPAPPNYDGYSDIQLSAEVAKFGFKPIKRRSAMIALLGQCWQQSCPAGDTHIRMSSSLAKGAAKRPRGRPRKTNSEETRLQEPPPSAQAPETPKRPRGRPRKATGADASPSASKSKPNVANGARGPVTPKRAGATMNVIEIPDSESEAMAGSLDSTPVSSTGSTLSSPQAVDLTMSVGEETELSLTMTPTDEQTMLFMAITKAITTAPRTRDPSDPSWHEKILLYDPIVLEDLAAWLNSGHLTRVKYDGEVNPVELKKWCESKSICCLWKVNLRGKERKRY